MKTVTSQLSIPQLLVPMSAIRARIDLEVLYNVLLCCIISNVDHLLLNNVHCAVVRHFKHVLSGAGILICFTLFAFGTLGAPNELYLCTLKYLYRHHFHLTARFPTIRYTFCCHAIVHLGLLTCQIPLKFATYKHVSDCIQGFCFPAWRICTLKFTPCHQSANFTWLGAEKITTS